MKSLEELKEIREKAQKKIDLRKLGDKDDIKIMVGMGTCGIAAGARGTMESLLEEINKNSIENAYVVQVGCMGQCHCEPLVQVNYPNKEPVLYGNVTSEKASEIIKQHILEGKVVEALVIEGSVHKN
ncbi:(2Fe-2S) ferredoxin domain-containing protein [Alkaliphilus peptidifermentans]|uniref:NADP-reducing hydrogenase subunit HndB n=1 Tax=Alkaliphilus peptidifermentans DSM 18978 TaxID=1120976 RepID=A0A1G5J773_9FIRM|nr:(2Fe-2S) ferredoxin domain-containing protein [Alkaliphilus peptidifermentans]SCY84087.1 NADP-reducing hydrogenase subunit HndB [Alkaliphilus peptidifermentans DSM 18978]